LNGKSKSGCIDENKQVVAQPAPFEDDHYFHVDEQPYKSERLKEKSQEFEKILKSYMKLVIDKKH
jgi:hypothetical protein